MKCKSCHNEVERTDLYCRYCGNQLFKQVKRELSVPKPKQLADNTYSAQIMVKGERYTIKGDSIEQYEIKARATKLSLLEMKKAPPKATLGDALDKYICCNCNTLSPSTLRGYNYIRSKRFQSYMNLNYTDIDYQAMVNDEAACCSAKTLHNAYALVKCSLKAVGYLAPDVNLPMVVTPDLLFLDYSQVKQFLVAIHGQS